MSNGPDIGTRLYVASAVLSHSFVITGEPAEKCVPWNDAIWAAQGEYKRIAHLKRPELGLRHYLKRLDRLVEEFNLRCHLAERHTDGYQEYLAQKWAATLVIRGAVERTLGAHYKGQPVV